MSTGADHYRHAEHLAAEAARHVEPPGNMRIAEVTAAVAQVYATLALAAATAASGLVSPAMGDSPDVTDWARAINWPGTTKPRCDAGRFTDAGVERCTREPGHEMENGHWWTEEPPF